MTSLGQLFFIIIVVVLKELFVYAKQQYHNCKIVIFFYNEFSMVRRATLQGILVDLSGEDGQVFRK